MAIAHNAVLRETLTFSLSHSLTLSLSHSLTLHPNSIVVGFRLGNLRVSAMRCMYTNCPSRGGLVGLKRMLKCEIHPSRISCPYSGDSGCSAWPHRAHPALRSPGKLAGDSSDSRHRLPPLSSPYPKGPRLPSQNKQCPTPSACRFLGSPLLPTGRSLSSLLVLGKTPTGGPDAKTLRVGGGGRRQGGGVYSNSCFQNI
jgi:hypothetical protein